MTKHTQGPWEVSFSQINAGKHECIVQFGFNIRENPKAYANARLIAAAPDLLDALKNLKGWFDYTKEYGADAYPINESYLTQATTAIAKAEGR